MVIVPVFNSGITGDAFGDKGRSDQERQEFCRTLYFFVPYQNSNKGNGGRKKNNKVILYIV
jgi:hypothetical protein